MAKRNAFAKEFGNFLSREKTLDLFEKEPVSLETFLYDFNYLNLTIKLSEKQTDVLKYSTQIYRETELKMLGWPVERNVNEIYLQWGKGCFLGTEKIALLDGREVSFRDLPKDKSFWVYSYSPEKGVVAGRGHSPRITKYVNTLVEVELDDGTKIRATPEHPFMLCDGSYKEIQSLKENDFLAPLNPLTPVRGQEVVDRLNSGELCPNLKGLETLRGSDSSSRKSKVVEIHQVNFDEALPVWDITVDGYHNFALASGVFVHNSGKDLISILTSARIADLLLCLKDPQGYFGMPGFANIDMVNMALNADQAKFNYYEPMRKLIGKSKRFKGLVDIKERHIAFAKNIYAHSGHSDEEAAEGKSLILAVLDELSGFKSQAEFSNLAQRLRAPKYSFEALVEAMKSSRQSRFDTGKLIAISYPRYKGCPIQQLYNAGLEDNKKLGESSKVYVSFGCTWEVNPIKKIEQFADEMRKNPKLVKAKYMCDPSQAEDSFIKNLDVIDETFPDVEEYKIPHTLGNYPSLKNEFRCRHRFACSVHIDLGLTTCRAGFAMTHVQDMQQVKFMNADTGLEEVIDLPIVGIDVVTSFQAPEGGEIDFSEIRKFLLTLRSAGYHISVVSYDQWQSVGERQILEKTGFNMVKRSVDNDRSMYDDLVIMMTERRLVGGYASYRTYNFAGQQMKTCVIKEELQGLVDVRGKRVDHRPAGGKDESDALAGSVRGAIEFGLWKFEPSADVPVAGRFQPCPRLAVMGVNNEMNIVERMKAMNGESRTPDNVGFRGMPR